MRPRIFISTGEVSGENHAMAMVRALERAATAAGGPCPAFAAMGGARLREAGMELVVDSGGHEVMGFVEIFRHIPFFRRAAQRVIDYLAGEQVDALVLVDNPGFNLRLARAVRRRLPRLPILYYIAPKAWAWRAGRARVLAGCVDLVLCIYPFEPAWFRERGVNAVYVGHPTVDSVRAAPGGEKLRRELLAGRAEKLLGIFPGSRVQELRRLLPLLLATVERLSGERPRCAVAAAPGFSRADLRACAPLPEAVAVVENRSLELMGASDALLVKSGTTTLEAALVGKPMVVAYRSHPVSAAIARRVVKLDWFSLPNIIAGREVVPEFFQGEATPALLAAKLERVLTDAGYAARMREGLREVRARMDEEPAAPRAARVIMNFLGDFGKS